MRQVRIRLLVAVFAILGVLGAGAVVKPGENLILNGTFESDQMEYPPYWTPSSTDRYIVRTSGGPCGLGYVSIVGRGVKTDENCIRQRGIRLVAGGRYRLSVQVRTKAFEFASASVCVGDEGMRQTIHVDRIPRDTNGEWKRLEKEFVCFDSADGNYVAQFYANGSSGEFDLTDVRIEALDEKAQAGSEASAVMAEQNSPRLVPFSVLMKLPRANAEVLFRFFGHLPDGTFDDYEVALSVDGSRENVRRPLVQGLMAFPLPTLSDKGVLHAFVVRRTSGTNIAEFRFPYAKISGERCVNEVGAVAKHRRLNNLATEVLSECLAERKTDLSFVTTRDGWVYVSLPVGVGATASVDGVQVISRQTPRAEAFRLLRAGKHSLSVHAMQAGGRVIVRSVAEMYDYCPCYDNSVTNNGSYGWAFQEKYVFPAATVFNCGQIPVDRQEELRRRGLKWIGNTWTRTFTPEELVHNLETCEGLAKSCYDGVSCDEMFFANPQQINSYTKGLWAYGLKHPNQRKQIYTWIVGKPSAGGMDHDFFAAAVNASGGDGRLLIEAYCRSKETESEAWDYARGYFCATVDKFRSWYPLAVPATSIVLGNFNQIPTISLAHHPEVDYKYFLDMQLNLIANDSSCRDIGSVGYWGSHSSDEELHRWSFALLRHYVVEGKTNLLSSCYGFTYRADYLQNGDFRSSLDGWMVKGNVVPDSCKDLAIKVEGRWGGNGGIGDTFASFRKYTNEVASVSQPFVGLVRGKPYRVRFMSFDVKDVAAGRRNPRRLGITARLTGSAEIDRDLTWTYVDDARRWSNDGVPRVNLHQIVFVPGSENVSLVIDNEKANPGDVIGVNYVSVTPYFCKTTNER